MKKLIVLLLLLPTIIVGGELIAKNSAGMVIELKEKYGRVQIDTCTVLMLHAGCFVAVRRDGSSGWYPATNYSAKIIEKIFDTDQ